MSDIHELRAENERLVAEVERLREAAVESSSLYAQWRDDCAARAEAAEAKVAKVEETIQREGKLHSTWDKRSEMVVPVDTLRAVLADAPAERTDLDRPCACGHRLTDHLDGLACYAGTTVTSEFACDCGEWRPDAPAEQRSDQARADAFDYRIRMAQVNLVFGILDKAIAHDDNPAVREFASGMRKAMGGPFDVTSPAEQRAEGGDAATEGSGCYVASFSEDTCGEHGGEWVYEDDGTTVLPECSRAVEFRAAAEGDGRG